MGGVAESVRRVAESFRKVAKRIISRDRLTEVYEDGNLGLNVDGSGPDDVLAVSRLCANLLFLSNHSEAQRENAPGKVCSHRADIVLNPACVWRLES